MQHPSRGAQRSSIAHKARSGLRKSKLLLLGLASLAMLTAPALAQETGNATGEASGTTTGDIPKDYSVNEIESMTDEEYQQIPLTDADQTRRRSELINMYKPGGSGYPLTVQIDSIHPNGGPTTGTTRVTVRGGPFKDMNLIHPNPKCKFGRNDMIVPAAYVSCSAAPIGPNDKEARKGEKNDWCLQCSDAPPNNDAEIINLSVSLTGTFEDTNDSEPYRYYFPTVIYAMQPHYGPKDGETIVKVWGNNFLNFGEKTRCNFGSRSVAAHYFSPTYIECKSPASDTIGLGVPFSITMNNQQSSKEQMYFYYYNRPVVAKLSPNYGPATGGNEIEIIGSGMAPFIELPNHYRMLADEIQVKPRGSYGNYTELQLMNTNDTFCQFVGVGKVKARVVSSTKAFCTAPPSWLDNAEVMLTLNNQDWSDDDVMYYWYKAAKLYDIQPKYGACEAGMPIRIYGTDFQKGHQLQCVFDGTIYVNATMINSQEIECKAPAMSAHVAKVQTTVVGDFGKSLSEPIFFNCIERPKIASIEPTCGPVTGYTQITVHGSNFANLGPNMAFCVFNNTIYMNATIINEKMLYCSSPKLPPNLQTLPARELNYQVKIAIGTKHTLSGDKVGFNYYHDAELSAVVGDKGPVSGNTTSILRGKGFAHPNICNFKVRYGAIETTPKFLNSTAIETRSPRVNLPGPVTISTSGNGQNYANDITMHYRDKENTFTYTQDLFVSYMQPQQGPTSGNTRIKISGLGFSQLKNDDGTPDLSHPLYYRFKGENGSNSKGENDNGTPLKVEEQSDSSFVVRSPACNAETGKKQTLEVSWDGQNWQPVLPGGKDHTFTCYDAPEVKMITPHFGPVKSPNNETIVIQGLNFKCPDGDCSNVMVRFGNREVNIYVPGTILDDTHIQCAVPKYTKPDVLPVEISLDGVDYTHNGVTYGFFDAYLLDVEPRLISKNGGTPLTLSGFGFVNAGQGETKSKFSVKGTAELNCAGQSPCYQDATYIDKNTLTVKTLPQSIVNFANNTNIGQNGFTVEASVYNNEFTNNNIMVWYIYDPLFKSISRNSTPINLSLPILVQTDFFWGTNDFTQFAKHSNFTCRFNVGNETYVTAARMETMPLGSRYENDEVSSEKRILPTHVLCASPRVKTPGSGTMDISINGFDYSGNFKYTFSPPVDVYRIQPESGPETEKTRVKLIGTGFLENKDTIIQKTGVLQTQELKGTEVKTLAWNEADFLASMYMTGDDLLTFKYTEQPLKQDQALQSVFVTIPPLPINITSSSLGGPNSITLGEEIDFTVEQTPTDSVPSSGRRLQDTGADTTSASSVGSGSTGSINTGPLQTTNTTSTTPTKPVAQQLVLASANTPNYKFTDSYPEFKTYKNPVVKKVFPNIGLTEGGTVLEVSGAWFDQQLEFGMLPFCKIGQKVVRGQFISTVRVICKTPPNDNIVQQQPIYVSLNGVNWVDTGFFFSYYVQPVLLGMSPRYGPQQGGTEIFIQGQRFSNITDPEFVKCKFSLIGNERQVSPKFIPAIYRDEQTMMCVSPNGFNGGEAVNLQLSFNGADYTDPKDFMVFTYYTVLGSFPHSGPADGFDQVILVRGSGLKSTDQVVCQLNNTNVAPVDVSPTLIQCPMCLPNKDPNAIGLVKFGVQIHGVFNDFGNFYYYEQIKMNSMIPHIGPSEGKGDIFFAGDLFRDDFPGAQLGCKIGDAVGEAVLSQDKTVMKCVVEKMPLAKENEPFEAKIALNSYSWVGTNPPNLFMPYGVTDIQPRSGPYAGFTDIFITGGGYTSDIAEFAKCRFGVDEDYAIVEAQVLDFNRMTCRSPENFKLPTEGAKSISVPFGISFGNDEYHPWTIGNNRYMFYENPYLVQAIPAEVKIGKMYEIFVKADPNKPYVEPVPSGPDNTIEPILCNFEDFGNSMGMYINSTHVMCVSPRISGRPDDYYREEVTVRVAINGQDYQQVESEAIVTFVGTGQAKGFINFIIATILVAVLIIVTTFLLFTIFMYNGQSRREPYTHSTLRENNMDHTTRARADQNRSSANYSQRPGIGGGSRQVGSRQVRSSQRDFRPAAQQ